VRKCDPVSKIAILQRCIIGTIRNMYRNMSVVTRHLRRARCATARYRIPSVLSLTKPRNVAECMSDMSLEHVLANERARSLEVAAG
jgi:hypothetical protein